MEHPILDASLVRFSKGIGSKAENRAIVAHLLKGCHHCSRRLRDLGPPPVADGAYDGALDRFCENLTKKLADVPEAASRHVVLAWPVPGPQGLRRR